MHNDIAIEHERIRRLAQVLKNFLSYEDRAFQLDLADAAILWTLASVACHRRRGDCESYFYSFVDLLYNLTPEVMDSVPEAQVRAALAAANVAIENLRPGLSEIFNASIRELVKLEKDHYARLVGDMLHVVRSTSLDNAPAPLLRDLVLTCVTLCKVVEVNRLGGAPESDVVVAVSALMKVAMELHNSVIDEVKRGHLVMRDGKISTP